MVLHFFDSLDSWIQYLLSLCCCVENNTECTTGRRGGMCRLHAVPSVPLAIKKISCLFGEKMRSVFVRDHDPIANVQSFLLTGE